MGSYSRDSLWSDNRLFYVMPGRPAASGVGASRRPSVAVFRAMRQGAPTAYERGAAKNCSIFLAAATPKTA
jgi:hypothetical protein